MNQSRAVEVFTFVSRFPLLSQRRDILTPYRALCRSLARGRCSTTMSTYQRKISFGEMRASGDRDVLINCRDHRCSYHGEIRADRWPIAAGNRSGRPVDASILLPAGYVRVVCVIMGPRDYQSRRVNVVWLSQLVDPPAASQKEALNDRDIWRLRSWPEAQSRGQRSQETIAGRPFPPPGPSYGPPSGTNASRCKAV
jgi:hypothetical protein